MKLFIVMLLSVAAFQSSAIAFQEPTSDTSAIHCAQNEMKSGQDVLNVGNIQGGVAGVAGVAH